MLKPRAILKSRVAKAPPHVREIFDFLVMKANHKSAQIGGTVIERGQLLITYDDIRDALAWKVGYRVERYTKWDCEKAMKVLKKATLIATEKTTRGLLITICNYNYYQDPANYESHNESYTRATREPQPTDTINKKLKNRRRKEYNEPDFLSDSFQKFYSAYPRHQARKAALEAWIKLSPDSTLMDRILAAITRQKRTQWQKNDAKFIPLPATWLNGRRWEDETPETKSAERGLAY